MTMENIILRFATIDSSARLHVAAPANEVNALLTSLPKTHNRDAYDFLAKSLIYSQPLAWAQFILRFPTHDLDVKQEYRGSIRYPGWTVTAGAENGILAVSVRDVVTELACDGLGVGKPGFMDADLALAFADALKRSLLTQASPPIKITAKSFAESLLVYCRDPIVAACVPGETVLKGLYAFVQEHREQVIPAPEQGAGPVNLGAVSLEDTLMQSLKEAAVRGRIEDPVAVMTNLYKNSTEARGVIETLGLGGKFSELSAGKAAAAKDLQASGQPKSDDEQPPIESLLVDLTQEARDGKLPPCIGRDREVDQVFVSLTRMTKNNPVLIGPAGVGKSAVVEAVAQAIVAGRCPEVLKKARILSTCSAALVAGSQYRGQFEARMQKLLQLTQSKENDVILFIDELHTIMGAGETRNGTNDGANILKPALARGKLKLIGATTTAEYHKYIAADAAFERRLQPIEVREPDDEAMRLILDRLVPVYAEAREVKVAPSVRSAILELARDYLPRRRFPDKAIDLLDEGASRAVSKGLVELTAREVEQVVADFAGLPVARVRMNRQERLTEALLPIVQNHPQTAETCRRLALYLTGVPALGCCGTRPVAFVCRGGTLASQAAEAVCDELAGPGSTLVVDGEALITPASSTRSRTATDSGERTWCGDLLAESPAVLVNDIENVPDVAIGTLLQAVRGRVPGANRAIFVFVVGVKGGVTGRRIGFGQPDEVDGKPAKANLAALLEAVDGIFVFPEDSPEEKQSETDATIERCVQEVAQAHGLQPEEQTQLAARLQQTCRAGQSRHYVEAAIWLAERAAPCETVQASASSSHLMTSAPPSEVPPCQKPEPAAPGPMISNDEDLVLAVQRTGHRAEFASILRTLESQELLPATVQEVLALNLKVFAKRGFIGPAKIERLQRLQDFLRSYGVAAGLPASEPSQAEQKAA